SQRRKPAGERAGKQHDEAGERAIVEARKIPRRRSSDRLLMPDLVDPHANPISPPSRLIDNNNAGSLAVLRAKMRTAPQQTRKLPRSSCGDNPSSRGAAQREIAVPASLGETGASQGRLPARRTRFMDEQWRPRSTRKR